MKDIVIVGVLRAPIGYFRGTSASHSVMELGSLVVKASIERTGVPAYAMDEVILGRMLTAEAGQNPTGQLAIKGSLPNSVSTITTNDVCGSGPKALHLATQAIQCGEVDIIIASGRENMNHAPHILTDSRTGAQLGNSQLVDNPMHNGLRGVFSDYHTGVTAENLAREYGIDHQLQGAYALSSQQKARVAIDAGRLKGEIVPVMAQSNGQTLVADTDEQSRTDASAEGLARLNPSFDSLGSMTAGNASPISDDVAAVMMMDEAKARALNLPVLAHIRALANAGVDPALMGIASVYVTRRCPERVGWQLADIDLIGANGAFTAQALSIGKMFERGGRRVNVNGGAIALGHPIGASGCRILVSLAHRMVKRNACKRLAMPCIDGGQGVALITERDEQLCISSLPINICRHQSAE